MYGYYGDSTNGGRCNRESNWRLNKLTINTTKQNTESGLETLEHYLNTIPVILKLM